MNLYVERVDAGKLYRLGLSVEIKTLVLSQAYWGVLSSGMLRMKRCCACPCQRGGGGLYRVRPCLLNALG